ncbi:hypothetical protein M513_05022 [Trichuris suis]|uniref:Mitochondrial fission 1 protein n=1 Tax=Trichuris suis TaxID=68888 RepID=A0A085M9V7_9BILA|nr:hypothetical protein M513_05022 [Trichuris suis]
MRLSQVAERAFQTELSSGKPSADATFLYAYFLVRSKESDVRLGLSLLSDLLNGNGSSKDDKLDYLFYTAVGHARLKVIPNERCDISNVYIQNFDFALSLLDAISDNDAFQERANALKEAIEKRILKESYVNKGVIFSIVGGIVITLATALLRLR